MELSGYFHALAAYSGIRNLGTHSTGRRLGPGAGLNAVAKIKFQLFPLQRIQLLLSARSLFPTLKVGKKYCTIT